ncbi:MAG: HAD-IG family 5'-nucleotidase [Deltaproteobacteria bacterium]|nr:HAD-IG family 5'-nucleotidase [Deltaproteobacteria bacterium]
MEVEKPPRARGVFCNRTLNMRSIKAIGYDMDYTLVDYHVEQWERRAYERARDKLGELGWPVQGLEYDPEAIIRGLVIDVELGNLVKANRFGFVKKAVHGTRELDYDQMRTAYMRTMVDLAQPRWVFINTLFSLSEACLYMQLVDLLDARKLPPGVGYRDLYLQVRGTIDAMHVEGDLKAEIIADPERFVKLDPELPLALLDQRNAGKKLLLITNSEWSYTVAMMTWTFDRYLGGDTWRDLFDVIVVGARKPEFFTTRSPLFEIVTDEGLLKPVIGDLEPCKAYFGGSATQIEKHLGISGDEILYVGDHMFGDVHVTKNVLRWRTGLVLRELEQEIGAIERFQATEHDIATRMIEKEALENELAHARVGLQRMKAGYGPKPRASDRALFERIAQLRARLSVLDQEIAPIAKQASELCNRQWGLLTRAGNDKSHLARQVERYADIYTSRVSNFLFATPFVYLRSPRGSLPHDPSTPSGPPLAAARGEAVE